MAARGPARPDSVATMWQSSFSYETAFRWALSAGEAEEA
jgi:hypothetical protein